MTAQTIDIESLPSIADCAIKAEGTGETGYTMVYRFLLHHARFIGLPGPA